MGVGGGVCVGGRGWGWQYTLGLVVIDSYFVIVLKKWARLGGGGGINHEILQCYS